MAVSLLNERVLTHKHRETAASYLCKRLDETIKKKLAFGANEISTDAAIVPVLSGSWH